MAVFETQPTWNYTTILDIAFLVLIAVMAWRFFTTGGPAMLRAMSQPGAGDHAQMDHGHMGHHEQHHDH